MNLLNLNLAEWTGVLAGVAALLTSFGTLYATNRAARKASDDANTLTWQGLNAAITKERDRLSAELRTIDADYKKKFQDMEYAYTQQLELCHARIAQLEEQVATMRQQLAE